MAVSYLDFNKLERGGEQGTLTKKHQDKYKKDLQKAFSVVYCNPG